jgi:hypothetical protein
MSPLSRPLASRPRSTVCARRHLRAMEQAVAAPLADAATLWFKVEAAPGGRRLGAPPVRVSALPNRLFQAGLMPKGPPHASPEVVGDASASGEHGPLPTVASIGSRLRWGRASPEFVKRLPRALGASSMM